LNILLRDANLLKFVKFLSHDAPSSRYDVAMEFLTDLTDDELRAAQAGEDAQGHGGGSGRGS
jgi:Oxoglutarate and iron-dependent oxygenase degradation C-term